MELVVTVKQVPDPNIPPAHFAIDETAKRVVSPAGIPPLMNGYDANGLEAALRLREQHGGKVTVVSAGDDGVRDTLRRAIAMGANAAVHVSEPGGLDGDASATALALAQAISRLGPVDLILCGRQASDTDAGQVLFAIAERLGLPAVSPVKKIVQVADGRLVVERISEDGTQRVSIQLPALIGVSSETNEPRYPAMKGVMAAKRAQIPTWTRAELAPGDGGSRVELRRLYREQRQARAELVEGESPAAIGARLAEKLHEAGLV
jgi:electron transfer flavoprotein beta subunit